MNNKIARVLSGFLKLNQAERHEFITELNKYIQTANFAERAHIEKSINNTSMTLGPAPNSCPCCGK